MSGIERTAWHCAGIVAERDLMQGSQARSGWIGALRVQQQVGGGMPLA